ncbi:preprotein translocase subunit SecG [Rubneribacter badeniensis]|uniref:Protein-export membrane protein SecG n=1 Tax=Rubneribacter badeniensis TaxID=2070688 RepID=A0A2K2U8C1_9ACTN|nr:preprotein translocase subunit SecG [Rubneribacter badeniensis]OUO95632.1 preprotein translocase subunit SecG [Gordonibacter sp. An232A]CVH79902.1 preprotein translocase subunit SecG [Coriobacteriaceae bacterium CHKCI002]HIW76629.1 preprotein translocase subunit SecG [Candidatus Gordonibacter avicola]PNV66509.1 preprotein translocase subunit SecG [Rubneribacter badeniensis]HJH42602.1 preprotein translocase subunit SecG [Rubneribacter badeniensis]
MNPLLIIMLVLLVLSGIGLIVFILLHSGKGTGISDMIASSVYSTQTGTSIVEKNLDRITIALAIVFMLSLIVLMIVYPKGSIG